VRPQFGCGHVEVEVPQKLQRSRVRNALLWPRVTLEELRYRQPARHDLHPSQGAVGYTVLIESMKARRSTLFEVIGGDALRAVIADFYRRLFGDVMIGFLFHGKDRSQLVQREWEFTARLLGSTMPYTGRSIREAHKRSPILGGHFERRLQILKETLADHDVDDEVKQKWLDHTVRLRAQVTADEGSECDHDAVPDLAKGDGDASA